LSFLKSLQSRGLIFENFYQADDGVLKFRRAEVLFRRVLNADESDAGALLGYAALLLDTGGVLDTAHHMIHQVLIATHTYARVYAYSHPYEAEALAAFGTFAAKTSGDYFGAEGWYREALRKDPTHLQARRMSESLVDSTTQYHIYICSYMFSRPIQHSPLQRLVFRSASAVEHIRKTFLYKKKFLI